MIVEKIENENNTFDIVLKDDNNALTICIDDNGDLLWKIYRSSNNYDEVTVETFIISNENEEVFNAFEKLYHDISNIVLHENDCPPRIKTIGELLQYKKDKYKFVKYNLYHYNELFSHKERLITLFSDGKKHEVANYLQIKKYDDCYQLDFKTRPRLEGYENEDTSEEIIVRISRSRSHYLEFSGIFMRLFNELQKIDDLKKIGHQYTLSEYMQYRNK